MDSSRFETCQVFLVYSPSLDVKNLSTDISPFAFLKQEFCLLFRRFSRLSSMTPATSSGHTCKTGFGPVALRFQGALNNANVSMQRLCRVSIQPHFQEGPTGPDSAWDSGVSRQALLCVTKTGRTQERSSHNRRVLEEHGFGKVPGEAHCAGYCTAPGGSTVDGSPWCLHLR
jgi:hypothetical protein